MSNTTNPLTLLKAEWVQTIRTEAAQAEKHGKPTKKVLSLVNDQDWLKIMAPSAYGGKQMSLPDVLQLEEALACADGSLGWFVTLCSGAGWFGGRMNADFAKKIFGTEKVCLAGSGAVTGTANLKNGNYTVNGKWPYATGATEATAFTANCMLTENGKPVNDDKGKQKVISIVLLKSEVLANADWNSFGMTGAGTGSFEVKDLSVSEERVFDMAAEATVTSALYYYPFHQMAEATLAINLSGMAFHFMDLCQQMINDKNNAEKIPHVDLNSLQDTFNTLMHKFQTARQKLYYAVDMSWQVCAANKDISQSVLYKVSAAASVCTYAIRNCVNTLYPYCGMQSANKDSEINRVWRDIHTAGQHSMLVGDGTF
ncbi:MAG: acyl-CoA dehydrogenase [Taibaiella sp.]|nr:acyl-CoA dehydrogenase [Taibaiella sp.]